jgi:DNA polymerase-3 subunit epsilon
MPGVPTVVADEIAAVLVGSSPRFLRNPDATWALKAASGVSLAGAPTVAPSSRLDSLRYLVVDVETTGLSPRVGDRITEIAAYELVGGEINQVFDSLVNPLRHIPPYISALTGITWEMVRSLPPFDAHSTRLHALLEGTVFVAHNAGFDWRFLSAELSRSCGHAPSPARLCTVKLARALLPALPRRSLDQVAFHFGVEIESRHRAAGDALATAKVLRHFLRMASSRGISTWGDLEALLVARSSYVRRRKRGSRRRSR